MSNTINLPDLCCAFEDHSPCSREVLSTQWCRPKVHTARHGRGYFVVCVVCVVKLKPCCRLVCAEGFRAIRILLECTSCMSCHRHGSVQVLLRSLPLGAQVGASGPTHRPQNPSVQQQRNFIRGQTTVRAQHADLSDFGARSSRSISSDRLSSRQLR